MASNVTGAVKETQWPSSASIYYPGSDDFVNATTRWNAYGCPKYDAAVSPSSEDEIAEIVGQSLSLPTPNHTHHQANADNSTAR